MIPGVEALLQDARAQTGLDDFGDPSFRDGLAVLVDAVQRDGHLNAIGDAAISGQLLGYLRARLEVQEYYRREPDIAAQTIRAPVFVTGLPRTGSTVLSNLLAVDPEARSLQFWESQQPIPPPEATTYASDPRIAAADAMLDGMKLAAPELAMMHDDTGTSPTENQDLLGQHFRTQHFEGMVNVPAYIQWWLRCDMDGAYQHHARVLKLLQWHCPAVRWNLKSPPDICHLDALRRTYPDVRVVWTHRDPAKVLPSVCKLIAVLRAMFSPHVDLHRLGRDQLALWSEAMRRGLAVRKRAADTIFADVFMHEVVARPVETLVHVYRQLGLTFSGEIETRMKRWLAANPQHKHGAPRYSLEEFGLRRDEVHAALREYIQYFDVPLEP